MAHIDPRTLIDEAKERLSVSLLDRRGDRISHILVHGDESSVHIDLALLAEMILTSRCRFLILAHNHPSGDPRPSMHDIRLTRAVATLARMLGARLVDHRISAGRKLFSFRAEGLI